MRSEQLRPALGLIGAISLLFAGVEVALLIEAGFEPAWLLVALPLGGLIYVATGLAGHSPSITSYSYPPAEVTDRIFRPQVQGGFGVQLPRSVWESYETFADKGSPPGPPPPTYIAYCN